MHAHFLPAGLVTALEGRSCAPNIVVDNAGKTTIGIHRTRIPYDRAFDDIDSRIASLQELGITRQVLSLPGLFGIDSLPAAESVGLTRAFNDGVARVVAHHADRFVGLASLPMADQANSIREYRRARTELGLAGMILPGDAFASVASAQLMQPLFQLAQELGGLIFIHPGPLPLHQDKGNVDAQTSHRDNVVHRRATVDIQNRLTDIMITLALSDFLDDFIDVPVQIANLGGSLPFIIERMDHVYSLRHPELPLPSRSLKPVYVDSASMGPGALALAVDLYGADRVLFGTDDPVFDASRALAAVRDSGLDETDQNAILEGNANELLKRIAAT